MLPQFGLPGKDVRRSVINPSDDLEFLAAELIYSHQKRLHDLRSEQPLEQYNFD